MAAIDMKQKSDINPAWWLGRVNKHKLDNKRLHYDKFSRDMNYVLNEKVEHADGLNKIRAAEGDGISAYVAMYCWYMGSSGQELVAKSTYVVNPPIPKSEGDIAAIMDKWKEQYNYMRKYDSQYQLPQPIVEAILRKIMIGQAREYYELLLDKKHTADELIDLVIEYASRKRLDAKKLDPDSMEVGSINMVSNYSGGTSTQDNSYYHHEAEASNYSEDQITWDKVNKLQDEINALTKGKGKGKGGKGPCYVCNKLGHIAANCWHNKDKEGDNQLKGKGKGKGFKGNCYNCGGWGHKGADCTSPKGGGKGKGINGVDDGNWQGEENEIGGIELGGAEIASVEHEWARAPIAIKLSDYLKPSPPPGLNQRQKKEITRITSNNRWGNRFAPFINSVEREDNQKEIMEVSPASPDNYEKVTITVDSGAADTVGPKRVGKTLPIRETKSSKAGINYRAANGTTIKNYGERRLEGWNGRGTKTGITMQVAEVGKVLGSVSKMTEANNTIIFSKGKSIITSDPTGEVAAAAIKAARPEGTTELEKRNGVYTFDMWIPKSELEMEEAPRQEDNYHNVGNISQDFTWLDDEVM